MSRSWVGIWLEVVKTTGDQAEEAGGRLRSVARKERRSPLNTRSSLRCSSPRERVSKFDNRDPLVKNAAHYLCTPLTSPARSSRSARRAGTVQLSCAAPGSDGIATAGTQARARRLRACAGPVAPGCLDGASPPTDEGPKGPLERLGRRKRRGHAKSRSRAAFGSPRVLRSDPRQRWASSQS